MSVITVPRRHQLAASIFCILIAIAAHPGWCATSCKDVACGSQLSCGSQPAAPVELSTLVDASDFPVGATTPIAFVDPGEGMPRRFIVMQEGVILVWDGATGTVLPTPFLDLRDDVGGPVLAGSEQGLLAMAADPNYSTNGHIFVVYTRKGPNPNTGDLVLARYTRSANPNVGDLASATTILVVEHTAAGNHNGGWLAFGPTDGFLYWSTGDGGGGCDDQLGTSGDGQRNDTLLGKMLRIDVNDVDPAAAAPDNCGVGSAGPYKVPSTNPFVAVPSACSEVYLLGLRNPFRFTFDRSTADLYIGDVGQNQFEEINLKRAATAAPVNFGWVCREGCGGADASGCSIAGCSVDPGTTCQFPRGSGLWDPILCHAGANHSRWVSIIGGYRYRGTHVPSLAGSYLYGDAGGCGQIWKTTTLDPTDPANVDSACWVSGFAGVYAFAEDHLGEQYVVVGAGGGASARVSCIHNGDGCYWAGWGFFADDFESGGTTHWSGTIPP